LAGVSITTLAKDATASRLFTRAEVLVLLKIGETTLHWLQRTGKLKPIRIGSRVLFNAAEINRVAAHGATLTTTEKQAAAANLLRPPAPTLTVPVVPPPPRRRGRPRKAPAHGVVATSSDTGEAA
jgi:hypothetical protein